MLRQAFRELDFIADHIAQNVRFDENTFQWEHIDKLAHQFKRHLRQILLEVDFAASQAQDPLIEAVAFLKEAFGKGKSLGQYPPQQFPIQFIPNKIKRYLYRQETPGQKHFFPDRYEFLVYRFLRNGLEAGDIFCRDSVRFRSFEDDVACDRTRVDNEQWQKKEQLIADTGLTILKQPSACDRTCQEHLKSLQQMLEERITKVNQRIISGENKHFHVKKRGKSSRWTLQYPRSSDPVNHPFFDRLRQVDIGDVMHFVNQQCRFMAAFEHWRHTAKPRLRLCAPLGRYTKPERDDHALTAALVAWATNTGLSRMAEISDIEYHILTAVSDNFIRRDASIIIEVPLETLSEANDCEKPLRRLTSFDASNDIAKLPIFQYFNIGDALHSSSDGQKFETQIPTISAEGLRLCRIAPRSSIFVEILWAQKRDCFLHFGSQPHPR